jgi:hypothetical protein
MIVSIKIKCQTSKENAHHNGGSFYFLLIQLKNLSAAKDKKKREKGKEIPQKSENGDIASRGLYHARRRPHDHVFGWITSFLRCATLFKFSEKAITLFIPKTRNKPTIAYLQNSWTITKNP